MPEPSLDAARRLRADGRLGEALVMLAALPDSLEVALEHACTQHAASLFDEAASTLTRLIATSSGEARAHRLLGRVHLSAGRYADAGAAYTRALTLVPDDPIAIAGRAEAMLRAGDHAGALAALERHIEGHAPHDAIATAFAHLARRAGRVEQALKMLDAALAAADISADRRSDALHARGEMLDALERYDEAFASFKESNDLRITRFDAEAQERLLQRVRSVYQPGASRILPNSGLESEAPIFILGMPRSGTSLVEQILASHPSVAAGGERPDMRNIIMSLPRRTAPPTPFPDAARIVPAQTLRQLANAYMAPLLGTGVGRITDKMPMNFMAIGLIAQLFPRARVIHCVRHPLDTCLSCYFSNFVGAHPYTRDLVALGRFYGQYQRMMAHWRSAPPASPLPIHEIRYEWLVADQEAQSRALIDFVGLPWDSACLRFHETDRAVHTASFDQVRRPMYSSSVGRWRHYAAHLAPLIETFRAEGVDPQTDALS
ncbi:MAG: sulfotransferase [Phycisphaeraceae bacterium]|nr:sulfotransferase [Phycisphaerales bacterium]MCB9842210.1 sulfotransferase [Phycisphaeraceae bacterium]